MESHPWSTNMEAGKIACTSQTYFGCLVDLFSELIQQTLTQSLYLILLTFEMTIVNNFQQTRS